jgi:hypothetical protein
MNNEHRSITAIMMFNNLNYLQTKVYLELLLYALRVFRSFNTLFQNSQLSIHRLPTEYHTVLRVDLNFIKVDIIHLHLD